MPVSLIALELVLDEIHSQRKVHLLEWQLSDSKRSDRLRTGCKVPDADGDNLLSLCIVHPSWTPIARHALGRILVLSDISLQSATSAISSPTFGLWTREVYLSFSRDYDEKEGLHDFIEQILARTPHILTFSLQTASSNLYSIDACVTSLLPSIHKLSQLRTLRLCSDIVHTLNDGNGVEDIMECPSLFEALAKMPDFDTLVLRGFFPCYKLVNDVRLEKNSENNYYWKMDLEMDPDPYILAGIIAESYPLTGKIYSLAELIRSIGNTPTEMAYAYVITAGNCMHFAIFNLNADRQQFVLNAAHVWDFMEYDAIDIRPPDFPCKKWCYDLVSLKISGTYSTTKTLSPFPSLKVLITSLKTYAQTADAMQDDLSGIISSLPSTLEVLDLGITWASPKKVPQGMSDELDNLFASLINSRCPNLKAFYLDLFCGPVLRPLGGLVRSCEERRIPLKIQYMGSDLAVRYGQWNAELDRSLLLENHV
ncbi:hypothetical protein SCHPADRAFT_901649 [Schizopora paradoxa]|uniref:Uncharacterized protein n=1 Tax=Schizopora paradoxa TaxID=27342 RepID=A0A0H2S3B6_9AGAM|nr:hypothetical protein SCHPADRAFT_901649 [Schizopora paradoxa]